jgi:hypothetical protein
MLGQESEEKLRLLKDENRLMRMFIKLNKSVTVN